MHTSSRETQNTAVHSEMRVVTKKNCWNSCVKHAILKHMTQTTRVQHNHILRHLSGIYENAVKIPSVEMEWWRIILISKQETRSVTWNARCTKKELLKLVRKSSFMESHIDTMLDEQNVYSIIKTFANTQCEGKECVYPSRQRAHSKPHKQVRHPYLEYLRCASRARVYTPSFGVDVE